jgi:hypothetical protein
MSTADLAAAILGGQSPSPDAKFHMGAVTKWDDGTGENTVFINGSEFTDLRVVTAGPAINIEEGDTVLVIRVQTQWFIMGKVAAPGASAAVRSVSDYIDANESTTNGALSDLTTTGPTVTTYIGPSGKALVLVSATLDVPPNAQAIMSFALSGANNEIAKGFRGAQFLSTISTFITLSRSIQVINLNPGQTTFTAKYSSGSGGRSFFQNRSLVVIPM